MEEKEKNIQSKVENLKLYFEGETEIYRVGFTSMRSKIEELAQLGNDLDQLREKIVAIQNAIA